jgi:GT2 family glycosyltransferase
MLLNTDTKLLIVIVLYKELLENSETFRSLLVEPNNLNFKRRLLIYDNSPSKRQDLSFLEKYNSIFEIEYISDESNPGISDAYNHALKLACKSNLKWLLLLDQDTKLPKNYIQTFTNTLEYSNTSSVSFIPRVQQEDNGLIISPFKINSFGLMKNFPHKISGTIDYKIIAINSGAFISTSFLSEIGGFSKKYPLDMLDFWLFSTIFLRKKSVYILDIDVIHDLSISNFENNVSLNRYISILNSENLFFSKGYKMRFIHKLRLLKRLLKQVRYKNKSYFKKTLQYLFK